MTISFLKGVFPKIKRNILVVISIPIVILIRCLSPLLVIRFGELLTFKVGHLAGNTGLYLCEKEAGYMEPNTHDIFFPEYKVSNLRLMKMLEKKIHVNQFASYLYEANRYFPGYERHQIPATSDRDRNSVLAITTSRLDFSEDDEQQGKDELARMGIPTGSPFICIIGRDKTYMEQYAPQRDWNYHNYRNMSINKFVPAAEAMAEKKYFVIRLGHLVQEPFESNSPKIIDYASKYRSEFMDIYLPAKCNFFVSSVSGLDTMPMIFRTPRAFINFIPFEFIPSWESGCVFIPKKLWLIKEKRMMRFKEIIESGAGRFLESEQYNKAGIEPLENTEDEIKDLFQEMDERLTGKWVIKEEDEILQRHFCGLFKPSDLHSTINAKIGAKFLRENRELLDV